MLSTGGGVPEEEAQGLATSTPSPLLGSPSKQQALDVAAGAADAGEAAEAATATAPAATTSALEEGAPCEAAGEPPAPKEPPRRGKRARNAPGAGLAAASASAEAVAAGGAASSAKRSRPPRGGKEQEAKAGGQTASKRGPPASKKGKGSGSDPDGWKAQLSSALDLFHRERSRRKLVRTRAPRLLARRGARGNT